jgi:flagellin
MAVNNSVLTNSGAMVALRNMNLINSNLNTTQNRISTGLKVTSALDDASNFAIAQGIRGELKATGAVQQALNGTMGVGKVALSGLTGVSNLLTDVQAKLGQLSNGSIDSTQRGILKDDFDGLMSQAANFLNNAKFNGINMFDANAVDIETISNLAGDTLKISEQQQSLLNIEALAGATIGTATDAINVIKTEFSTLETEVNNALAELGKEIRAMDLQTTFLTEVKDSTAEGLGAIVDADLAAESARLTSLQVQQQLSQQALGIANQRPQSLLSLFR